MIEYANDSVIRLLKQYDMLAKSLNYIDDITQKNDICNQMTKIIKQVLEITNSIYEEKYKKVASRSVYLMEDEKNRLLELINLINERIAYINNQLTSNKELTGISFETNSVLGEDKLDEYKTNVKIIERYKNNIRLESVLKDEIKNLDETIKKANNKINNNKNLNRQLEEKMIRIVTGALEKLSLFELKEREKEIDLAYTELGYSLEKAKENAKIARRDCTEEIILECDNILASTTLDYERYQEKKLILKLIYLYKNPINNYDELLNKREEINNILLNITNSELYSIIGNELNKEYSTIKLESQDMATLKSLMEEREIKTQKLKEVKEENNSDSIKGLLANLLENERKYQEQLEKEKRKKEQEKLEQEKIEEQKKLEELAKRQKELEEERNKEIERRTKQLLDEKKNPILINSNAKDTKDERKKIDTESRNHSTALPKSPFITSKETSIRFEKKGIETNKNNILKEETNTKTENIHSNKVSKNDNNTHIVFPNKNDFFQKENKNERRVEEGIPVIKNNNVISAKKVDNSHDSKIFPDIPLEKKETIFPEKKANDSFFDENEFNDLSNHIEGNKKESWF